MHSCISDYFDISKYYGRAVFLAAYGGRGIGKTYSALKMGLEKKIKILYLRRTDKQLELSFSKVCNPYKTLNADTGRNVTVKTEGGISYASDSSQPSEIIAYGASLSTFYNIRGIDFSDVECILFDEFQRRSNERPIKNEGQAFLDLYESVSRNRELQGKEPLRVIFLTNAVSVYSEVLVEFGLEDVVERMLLSGQERMYIPDKAFEILVIGDRLDISIKKAETALYRAIESDYKDFAIGNRFTDDSFYNVRKVNLKEYYPKFSVYKIYFYIHKSKGIWHAAYSRSDCPHFDKDNMVIFKRQHYPFLREAFMENKITYRTYSIKKSVEKIIWGG